MNKTAIVIAKRVDSKILFLRGQKVILDADLAELYGVSVKRLNQQIKRNARRFPCDFLFRLSPAEDENLRSQFATSSFSHGGRRYLPHAFTEHGAIMAATVLNSKRAIEMSVFVVRAFVRMREALAMNQRIVAKLAELERHLESHDAEIQELIEAIRQLMVPAAASRRRIGFEVPGASANGHSKGLTGHIMKRPKCRRTTTARHSH
jgi:phage regulator Rha-like protein